MATYANRLALRTELLAKLIKLITKERTQSYQVLADSMGVQRNVLYYYVGVTQKKGEEPNHKSVKVEIMVKILDWFEKTDFENGNFTRKQKSLAKKIFSTFQKDFRGDSYGVISSGFDLDISEIKKLKENLEGSFLGFRWRGKTKQIQVSGMQFYYDTYSESFKWTMLFYQGEISVEPGKSISKDDQDILKVEGQVTVEGLIATCIGKRDGSNEIYMLNIMLKEDPKDDYRYAMLSTYSRDEAIARAILLKRNQNASHLDPISQINELGDKSILNIKRRFGEEIDTDSLACGLSVAPGRFKDLKEEHNI